MKVIQEIISGIYGLRNLISKKIYVGSSISIYDRYDDHIKALKGKYHKNRHLQRSYNKYGNVFVHGIIKECPEDQFETLEIFYIKEHKALNKRLGYNITDDTNRSKQKNSTIVYQFNLEGKLIKKYQSIRQAAREVNIDKAAIKRKINKLGISRDSFWTTTKKPKYTIKDLKEHYKCSYTWTKERDFKSEQSKNSKKILQLSLDNTPITEFNSIKEASRVTNIGSKEISKVCRELPKYKSAGGFKWKYVG